MGSSSLRMTSFHREYGARMMNRAFSPSSCATPNFAPRHFPCHRSIQTQTSSGTFLSGSRSKTYERSPSQLEAASSYSFDELMRSTYSVSQSWLGKTGTAVSLHRTMRAARSPRESNRVLRRGSKRLELPSGDQYRELDPVERHM